MMPVVSAGSNQVGAIFTWIAHVVWPLGSPFFARAVLRCGHTSCQGNTPVPPLTSPRNRRRVREDNSSTGLWTIPIPSCGTQPAVHDLCLSDIYRPFPDTVRARTRIVIWQQSQEHSG